MQNFEDYVENRDNLNEGPLNWLKNKFWGGQEENPPADAQKAARALTPQQAGRPAFVRPPMRPSTAPTEDERAYGSKLYGGMASQGRDAQAMQQQQQQPGRVKFTGQYLNDVADSAERFLNLIRGFAGRVKDQTSDRIAHEAIAQSFAQTVMPRMQTLQSWVDWARQMVQNLQQRQQREWVGLDEEEQMLSEAMKVNFGKFEEIQKSIQDINFAMRQWLNNLGSVVPQFQPYLDRFQKAYMKNVVENKITANLALKFQSMGKMIQDLMSNHGRAYQGMGQRQPGTGDWAKQAPNLLGDMGSKLAGQMAAQQQYAQQKIANRGLEAQNVRAAQERERAMQQPLPSKPRPPMGSMLSRG